MWPIIGTEAIAAGALTRGALRWRYTAVHPDVYQINGARTDLYTRTVAAWLWTRRTGIIAGQAAAALYGVPWIQDTAPVELIGKHGRRQPGVVVREERIADDEVHMIGELPVTSPARTALDLARRLPRDEAVARLDAVSAVTGISAMDIKPLEERYRAARGVRSAREALDLMDGGARSPQETSLRLLLIDAGLPRPRTVDYDDGQRGLTAIQEIACDELFQRLGWFHIRAHPKHARRFTVHRVRNALRRHERR
jgi:hypothetical protein